MTRKQLIIIPGLGDRVWLYRLIKPLWTLFGFNVHIFVFGWNNQHTEVGEVLRRLGGYIDVLSTDRMYVVGVSAGGTAAVNILALEPQAIVKAVTVCTPYMHVAHHENAPFWQSMQALYKNLDAMSAETKAKLLSLHGLYDQTVPVGNSQPDGIASKRLWAVGHGLSIVLALTLYSGTIRQFFNRAPRPKPHR